MEDIHHATRKRKRSESTSLPVDSTSARETVGHDETHSHSHSFSMHSHRYPKLPTEILHRRQAVDGSSDGSSDGAVVVTITSQTFVTAPASSQDPAPTTFESSYVAPTADPSTPAFVASTSTFPSAVAASSPQSILSSFFSTPAAVTSSFSVIHSGTVDSSHIASIIVSVASGFPSNGTALYPTNSSNSTSVKTTTSQSSSGSSGTLTILATTGKSTTASPFPKQTPLASLRTSTVSSSVPSILGSSTFDISTIPTTSSAVFLGTASFPASTSSASSLADVGDATLNPDGSLTPVGKSIVGGVVGGAAAISVVVLVLIIAVRWWRSHGNDTSHDDFDEEGPATGPARALGAGPSPAAPAFVPVAAMGFLRRFANGRGTPPAPIEPEPTIGSGGFERLGGRKLPSQFSPGMEGPGPGRAYVPSGSSNFVGPNYPSGSSRYPSGGTYGTVASMSDNPFADPASPTYSNLSRNPPPPQLVGLAISGDSPSPMHSPAFGQFNEMQMRRQQQPLLSTGRGTPPPRGGAGGSRFVEGI